MNHSEPCLGMLLKGYPRISESFISNEILLLESMGIPIEIYSLRQPREPIRHASVKQIRAPVTYLPEYVLPHFKTLFKTNARLVKRLGKRYFLQLLGAGKRAFERRETATLRHFLQAGHLCETCLLGSRVSHLHAHFCHTPTSVALFASQLTGLSFSFTAHAKDIYISEPEQLKRKIELARFVVTCTHYNAHYLRQCSSGATSIYTIYHGIDLSFFRYDPVPLPKVPYRILSIGRLVPKKGYDDLLRALKLLDEQGIDFVFTHIGSGEQEKEITRFTHELGLTRKVRFLGTLTHSQVIHHYRNSHCFVLACKIAPNGDRDGIPNVLVEAMAVGLPVVSTRVSAIPELVEDGVTGTLVEPANPQVLAKAIVHVLISPHRFREQLPQARAKVEELFDNRRCVQQLHALFNSVIHEHRAPALRSTVSADKANDRQDSLESSLACPV